MKVQVNKFLKNKEYYSSYFPNKTSDWHSPTDYNLDDLKNIIFSGQAIKFGCQINELENRNRNVAYAQGTYIDIDDISKNVLDQILLDPLTRHAFLVHHSYSSEPEKNKNSIHICFRYNDTVQSWEEQTTINRKLYSYYKDRYSVSLKYDNNGKIDTGCFNANRIKFGTDKPNSLIYESDHVLDLNEISLFQDTLNQINTKNISDKGDHVSTERTREIFHKIMTDLREHIQWDNPDEVFCFYEHEFHKRSSNLSGAIQYDGYDPRNESKDNRSKSFVVTLLETGEWIWRSRAKNIGGSLPEYYYRVHHQDFETLELNKSHWWQGVELLYKKYFLIDLFNNSFRKLPTEHILVSKFFAVYEESFYRDNNENIYFYKNNHWKKIELFQCIDLFNDWCKANYGITHVLNIKYYQQLEKTWKMLSPNRRLDHFLHDWDYYPFANCLFHVPTKKAISYNSNVRNTFISHYILATEYEYPKELRQFLNIVLKYPEHTDFLIDVMVLIIQGKLFKLGVFLQLMGTSGSGKSTIARILDVLVNDKPSGDANLTQFCDPNNRFHLSAILTGKRLVLFEDQSQKIYNTQNLKNFCDGISDPDKQYVTMRAEAKRVQNHLEINSNAQTVITSEQDIFRNDADKGGEIRRSYSFEFANISDEAKNLANVFRKKLWLNNFLIWALHQNGDEILQRYLTPNNELQQWLDTTRDRIRKSGDTVYNFVQSNLQITDNPDDYITAADLYDRWNIWKNDETDPRSGKISKTVLGKAISKTLKEIYKWDNSTNFKNIYIGGKYVRCYTKIKFKEDDPRSIILE